MVSQVQSEKIGQMLKDGWTTVPRKSSDTNRTVGGPLAPRRHCPASRRGLLPRSKRCSQSRVL
jgi:hypothetical protein